MIRGLGSGNNGEFTFIDIIALIGFVVGLENLDLNITQDDFQKATAELDKHVNDGINQVLSEIHSHLKTQDRRLNDIIKELEAIRNENN